MSGTRLRLIHGAAAGIIGLGVMATAGAPARALAVQAASLAIGAGLVALAWRGRAAPGHALAWLWVGAVLAGLPLIAGPEMEGVRRWLAAGPLLVQPAMIVLPPMIWLYARDAAGRAGAAAMIAMALILALQPDAAGAAALAAGLAVCAGMRRRAADGAAAVAALGALGWAATRFDPLAPVAYVERAIQAAAGASPVVGIAGALVLISLPLAFVTRQRRPEDLALAACWAGLAAAGGWGNFPQPIVGYGASLALGWGLSLACGVWADRRRGSVSGAGDGEPIC